MTDRFTCYIYDGDNATSKCDVFYVFFDDDLAFIYEIQFYIKQKL